MSNIPLTLQSSKVTLSSVQGLNLTVLGTLTLPYTFAPNLESFNVEIYVIEEFAMSYDGLLGLDSLVLHNIFFPNRHALSRHECFNSAMTVSVPLPSAASLAASLNSVSTASSVKGNRSPSTPRPVSAVLIGDQYIGPCSTARLSVRVHDASVSSAVLSLLDSMRGSLLSLESTFSSVDAHPVTYVLVTNTSGAPITLKQDVLGTFEMFYPSPLEEFSPLLVTGVSTQLVDEDLSDVVAQLTPYTKTLD